MRPSAAVLPPVRDEAYSPVIGRPTIAAPSLLCSVTSSCRASLDATRSGAETVMRGVSAVGCGAGSVGLGAVAAGSVSPADDGDAAVGSGVGEAVVPGSDVGTAEPVAAGVADGDGVPDAGVALG